MIETQEYKSTSHCRYSCQYHVIIVPKYRYSVLEEEYANELKKIFQEIAEKYEYEIIEVEVMEDHVHLFVGAKPTIAPAVMVKTFKSISAIEMFKRFPKLKKFYDRCGSLQSDGKFIATIGRVAESTIRKYIQEQKGRK